VCCEYVFKLTGFDVVPFDHTADYESLDKDVDEMEMDALESMQVLNKDDVPNADDLDKREDASLRMAVELADSWMWRRGFAIFLCVVYMAAFLFKSCKFVINGGIILRFLLHYFLIFSDCFFFLSKPPATQANYTLIQPVLVVDHFHTTVEFQAGGILFFALFLDFKEIYHVLLRVVPCTDSLVPFVTLDTTFDVNSLFIGNNRISLEDVKEAHTFNTLFLVMTMMGYVLGCLPWCLISMLVRDLYLPFDIMRMLTPTLGSVIVARAILGPSIFLKASMALFAVLDFSLKGREDLGLAFKAKKSRLAAVNMALGFACIGSLLLCIVWYDLAAIAFPMLLFIGFFYGAITGCSHELTLKPWMLVTTITDGVWLKVKQKKRCPCVYWGGYCSDMHDTNEMFIIFPKDPVLFLGRLKGSLDDAAG
jgi:hypothetical protein